MPQNQIEHRVYQFSPNESNDGHIEGLAIVYNSATDIGGLFQETIERGALDSTDLTDVPLLVNHNMDMIPIARSRRNNGNSSMTLATRDDGLHVSSDLDIEHNQTSSEAYSAINRGDLDGMSFAFTVEDERWEDLDSDYPKRFITKIKKVYEVSIVTFPAYSDTGVYARDGRNALENARAALDSALEKHSGQNDTTKADVELLKAKYFYKYGSK